MSEGGVVEVRTQSVASFRICHCTHLSVSANAHVPVLCAISLHRAVSVARMNALNILGGKRSIAHDARAVKAGTSWRKNNLKSSFVAW